MTIVGRALTALAIVVATAGSASAAVGVTDGDTLKIDGERVRLWGVDAPEMRQQCTRAGKPFDCGREARMALARLVAGRTVSCTAVDVDRYKRTVARCTAAGADIGGEMVRIGWALDYRQYSHGYYGPQEDRARRAGLGLWGDSVSFTNPWEWRRR